MRLAVLVCGSAMTVIGCSLLTPLDGYSREIEFIEAGIPETGGGGDGSIRATAYRDAILADRPAIYLRFEEENGTIARDEVSGEAGLHERVTVGVSGAFPGSRAVLYPNDSDGHTTFAKRGIGFPGTAPYAFEAWVRPGRMESNTCIASVETAVAPRDGWSLLANASGHLIYQVWDPVLGDAARSSTCDACRLTAGAFHHLVWSYDGVRHVHYFIDGVELEAADEPSPASSTGGELVIGCRRAAGTGLEDCLDDWIVDEVALYEHVLDASAVARHHGLGRP
jgi:hypothetical protein